MAVEVDASAPIRVSGTTAGITTASFTAPANALLVACDEYDGTGSVTSLTMADTGGLSWTKQAERTAAETEAGGGSVIWTARTTSSVSRTVTSTLSTAWRHSLKCYVLTGVDVDDTPVDTVGANNEGQSLANSFSTTSLTPGATGLLIAAACDWTAGGGAAYEASSNLTQDTAFYSGAISVMDGYRTCTSGVGVTANLNGGGTGACQHKWCQIIVREGDEGDATTLRAEMLGEGSTGVGTF